MSHRKCNNVPNEPHWPVNQPFRTTSAYRCQTYHAHLITPLYKEAQEKWVGLPSSFLLYSTHRTNFDLGVASWPISPLFDGMGPILTQQRHIHQSQQGTLDEHLANGSSLIVVFLTLSVQNTCQDASKYDLQYQSVCQAFCKISKHLTNTFKTL